MKKTALLTALVVLVSVNASAQQSTSLEPTLIKTDPVPLESGEDGKIYLKIRNTGDTEADSVNVTVIDSFPFQLKPDRTRSRSIGTVTPGEEYHFSPEVLVADNAPDGENDFLVRIKGDGLSVTHRVPVEVESEEVDLNVANVKTVPDQLRPDTEDAKLSIDTVNNGDSTAENVIIDLSLPYSFEPVSSLTTRKSLGSIEAGETKTSDFSFDINESAEKGLVTVSGRLSYRSEEDSPVMEEPFSLDLYLSGAPQYEVVDATADLKQGQSGSIEVTVRNTGSEKSESTRVRILDSSEIPISYGSSTGFIGTLEQGEEGKAVFQADVDSDAAVKDYLVDLEIRGVRDTNVFVEDRTVRLDVGAAEQRFPGVMPLAAGIVIVVLIVGLVFREKLREKAGF